MEQNYVTVILRIKLKNIAYTKTSSQKKHQNFRATGSGWPISGYASTAREYR